MARLDPDRWAAVAAVFERVVDASPAVQDALLRELTEHDPELRDLVRQMLDGDARGDQLLDAELEDVAALAFAADDDDALAPGAQVGDFEIIGQLGRGGMGIVYRARDQRLGREAALKLLPESVAGTLVAADRLLAEARAASALDHPNIATVYQIGEAADGRRFIALALYEGETLRERLARGAMSPKEALAIAVQVARGLAAAHEAGIVHRDVKPANIFVTRHGLVKLLDFGIAAMAGASSGAVTTQGTATYMSPQQARGEAPAPSDDVWSLGILLYEMIAGETPFAGASTSEVLDRVRAPQPAPRLRTASRISAELDRIVARTLSKDAAARFPDAGSLLREFERYERARNRRVAARSVAAAALILIAALAGLIIGGMPFGNGSGAPDPASTIGDKRPRLAILSLDNLSQDTLDSYLVEGFTEELAARLGGLERLRVKSPRTTRRIQRGASRLDPVSIGETLQVDYLVEGSLRRERDRVRISVRLTQTDGGFVLWNESYDAAQLELLDVQEAIARQVATRIAGRLFPQEQFTLGRRATGNPLAYDHFLRGNHHLRHRTPDRVIRAIDEYQRAARLDSGFAVARAREAYAYALMLDWGWTFPNATAEELLARGLGITEQILQRDSVVADAWTARGYLFVLRDPVRHQGAAEAFRRAISLDSTDAEVYHQLGQTMMVLGRADEAQAAYRRALEIDPQRAMTLVPLSAIARRERRFEEADLLIDSAIKVDPSVPYAHAARGLRRLYAGNAAGARSDAEMALQLDSSYGLPSRSVRAGALHLLGDTSAAQRELRLSRQLVPDPRRPSPTEAYYLGAALMVFDRRDEVLDLIEHARPRSAWLWFYFADPFFDSLREHPRFRRVMDQVGPPDRS